MQSIYVETMRLHVSINITRELKESMVLGGYSLAKGAILQAPTALSHLDEDLWGNGEHPASEFWAERHVKVVEKVSGGGKVTTSKEFAMAGKASEFFLYGKPAPPFFPFPSVIRSPKTDVSFAQTKLIDDRRWHFYMPWTTFR